MLLAFTDESYSGRRYYQSAFIVEADDLELLELLILEANQYAQGFGVPAGIEYHGHSIMSASKGWEVLGNGFGSKVAIYTDVLQRISRTRGTLIIQGVDINCLNNRYSYPQPPHEITHKNLLDTVDRYAESKNDSVIIYSDQTATEKRLNDLFLLYQIKSTGGPFPRYLRNIVKIEYVESHHHAGIQIADLCVFLFRRLDDHEEVNPKTRKAVEKMWQILNPRIHPNYLPRVWSP